MEINYREIDRIVSLKEINYLKQLAAQHQNYELAAAARDKEKFLMTEKGQIWAAKEIAKRKSEERTKKLNRLFLSDNND